MNIKDKVIQNFVPKEKIVLFGEDGQKITLEFDKYYCTAVDFAEYIMQKYKNKFDKMISHIKLQKSIYLCFAHWGGLAKIGELANNECDKIISEYLFKDEFEAWSYGPVVKSVIDFYHFIIAKGEEYFKEIKNQEYLFQDCPEVKEYIDDLLDELFKISDFKLVEITHRDKVWQNHFEPLNDKVSKIIPHNEIITEYADKFNIKNIDFRKFL